jgi:hypothetical protein
VTTSHDVVFPFIMTNYYNFFLYHIYIGTDLQLFIHDMVCGKCRDGASNILVYARRLGCDPDFIVRMERHVHNHQTLVAARDLLRRGVSTGNISNTVYVVVCIMNLIFIFYYY